MTRTHRGEIYPARLDAARIAWGVDRSQSESLARKAAHQGRYWIFGMPALPFRFQLLAIDRLSASSTSYSADAAITPGSAG